ncbi:hypothetical protein JXO52_01700 [bacterium]|nr:hypothetical protein [bacterium]
MRTRFFLFLLALITGASVTAQPLVKPEKSEWTGSAEQKIWGLMTVWAQTKFCFPHVERLQKMNWDSTARSFIPRVLAADSKEAYYRTLMELAALLNDSHTEVTPPWGRFTPGYDYPPIEVYVEHGRFYILRTGDTEEIREQGVVPGMEIITAGDGIPIETYFRNQVLRYYSRGSGRTDHTLLLFYLFYGPGGEPVTMSVRAADGTTRTVTLTRNSNIGQGPPFMPVFVRYSFMDTIESSLLPGNILYINLPNFQAENTGVRDDFLALMDATDFSSLKGMIIDLRWNLGGSHAIMHPIVSCLIDTAVSTPADHYFRFAPVWINWDKTRALTWDQQTGRVQPRPGSRYSGPLVLLTGPYTHSSGEDIVIELKQRGRCLTVGEATAGGAGGRLAFPLPGGGEFAVSTFRATFPDGSEYMGSGITPDISVRPDREDIIAGRDPVLDRAVETIIQWQEH